MEVNRLRRMTMQVTSAGLACTRLQVSAIWRESWLYIFSILSEREFHIAHCLVYGSDVSRRFGGLCAQVKHAHEQITCTTMDRPNQGQSHQEDCSLWTETSTAALPLWGVGRYEAHPAAPPPSATPWDSQAHIFPGTVPPITSRKWSHSPGLHFRPPAPWGTRPAGRPHNGRVTSIPLPELDHLRTEVARLQSLVQQIKPGPPQLSVIPFLQPLPHLHPPLTSQPLLVSLSVRW